MLEKIIVFLGLRVFGRAFQIRQPVLAMFLIFRSRPDHTTVLLVMVAQTAVGRETWDPF